MLVYLVGTTNSFYRFTNDNGNIASLPSSHFQLQEMRSKSFMPNRRTENGWDPCPPGMIKCIAAHSVDVKRRQFMILSAATVAIAGGGFVLHDYLSTDVGTIPNQLDLNLGLSCREARENLDKYIADQLDKSMTARISEHLRICRSCETLRLAKLTQFS